MSDARTQKLTAAFKRTIADLEAENRRLKAKCSSLETDLEAYADQNIALNDACVKYEQELAAFKSADAVVGLPDSEPADEA